MYLICHYNCLRCFVSLGLALLVAKALFTLEFLWDLRLSLVTTKYLFWAQESLLLSFLKIKSTFDCHDMENVPLGFSCIVQYGALNNVNYHFLFLYLLVVFSICCSSALICILHFAFCLHLLGDACDQNG